MPPEDNHNVYDKDDDKPVDRRKGSSETDEPRTIHKNPADGGKSDAEPREGLRGSEEAGEGYYHPDADEVRRNSVARAHSALSELSGAEGATGQNLFSGGGGSGNPGVFKTMKHTLRQRRKVVAGGGAAAGVTAIIVATFLLLIPLKIEHIVSNLESRFFSSSNNAVEQATQNMFERYMVSHVLPSYKRCGSTISKDCSVRIVGNGPVSNLYRTWANAKLENKLADNYGIEFKYDKNSKNWHLKAPDTNPGGDNIGPDGAGLEGDFKRADRAAMRAAVNDSIQNETRWKKVMMRYKVGRLLEEKYGIKRCIVFCGTRDSLAGKKDAKIKMAKLKFVQRVITPRTDSLGIVLECMLNGCDPTKTNPIPAEDGTTGELHGSPENAETDTAVRESNQRLAAAFAGESADKLLSDYNDIAEKGFSGYMLEKVLTKVGLESVASQAADAIPIVGVIIAGSHIISFAHNAGPAVQKLGYVVNSGSYAQTYQMYSTYRDEIHTGNVDATEVGSFTNSLGSGNRGTPSNPQVGGTAGAEQTRLYQSLINDKSPGATTTFNGLLPAKASAASNDTTEKCNDGGPIPGVALVCPELVLGQVVGPLNAASQFLELPVVGSVTYLADKVTGIVGVIGNILGSIISSIPGIGAAIQSVSDLISQVLQPFFTAAINILIPNPVSDVMSGGRVFDLMAGGADVAGNLFAQVGLGGQALTNLQAADIVNQQRDEAQQVFSHQSLFARMFNTDSQYSLVSKVAMSIPFGLQTDAQSGLASLLNPLGAFSHGFGSMLSGKVNAAVAAQGDPFGVKQYGYPPGTIPDDPEAYWNQHCSDDPSKAYMKDNSWNEQAANTVDSDTGMPENKTTNPCLLIMATVGSAGGYFNTSNLTPDDLADQTGGSSGGSAPTTPISGDAQQLAQQILQQSQAGHIQFNVLVSSDSSDGSTPEDNIKETANGQPAKTTSNCSGRGAQPPNATVNLNVDLLKFILELSQAENIQINALAGQCHSSSGSNHYQGKAVDFGCPFDAGPADSIGKKYNISDGTGETCSNASHYHYSIGGN